MKNHEHVYAPSSASRADVQITKKSVIIWAAVIIGLSIFLGALAIGLGVGLGLGLRKKDSSESPNSSTCNPTTATCGCPSIEPSISARIVNGDVARSNSWPWMVAIYVSNGKLCGGTLITYEHVLTAAHCVFDVTPADLILYAGIQRLSERSNGQVRSVSTITVHPNYVDSTKINDLAILKLSSPLNASTTIGLCCLSIVNSAPSVGKLATFIGWGRTSANSEFSDELRQGTTAIVNSSLCNYTSVTDNQICTGNTPSVACYGESGSPLMMKINNAWTCVGVVNMGLLTCDFYVVFTRVSRYISFISNAIST